MSRKHEISQSPPPGIVANLHGNMPPDAPEIDRIVGQRVRLLRQARGYPQQKLAEKLGISFQQLQKYERGINRISASKLWQMGQILSVDVAEFFSDVGGEDGSLQHENYAQALEAAMLLSLIPDAQVRDGLMKLIRDCANDG